MRMLIDGRIVPTAMIQEMMNDLLRHHPRMNRQEAAKIATEEAINQIMLRNAAFTEFPDVPANLVEQEFARLREQVGGEAGIRRLCEQNHVTEERIREDLGGSLRVRLMVEKIVGGAPEAERDRLMHEWFRDARQRTQVTIHK